MKVCAIIAEYNPYHNGHKYLSEKAKELTNCDYLLSIMSGNFLQRGVPAMWDKYTRAKACVSDQIDLALELPVPYATGSANDFAMGAVSILNKLNIIDYLCFGVETDDIDLFNRISNIIVDESEEFKIRMKESLATGLSYPRARANAISYILDNQNLNDILNNPNNILAIEYICALKKTKSKIKPILIKRISAGYHETQLNNYISSATAIREKINDITSYPEIKSNLTNDCYNILFNSHKINGPVYDEDLSPFVQAHLLMSNHDYSNICDISHELANKLDNIKPYNSFNGLIDSIKSKNYTYSRISRCLLHLVLNYTKDHRFTFIEDDYAYYANVLSFKKNKNDLLKQLNKAASIPLIIKKADFNNILSSYDAVNYSNALTMWNLDTNATALYNCLLFNRYKTIHPNDFNTILPII